MATLEELHAKLVESGFTKLPVFEHSMDDIVGVVYSQDLLQVADTDLLKRRVRELMKPVLFMPETKVGSELLREMRQKDQTMAIIIDEHGTVAGIATMEDLVERNRWRGRSGWHPPKAGNGTGRNDLAGDAREHSDRRCGRDAWRALWRNGG